MRGVPASIKLLRPRSASEALRLYAGNPLASPLAGGTDFMVLWNMGALNEKTVLDLSGVKEWSGIRPMPGGLRIGALATHAEIRDNPLVRRHFPLLAQACATVGAAQIQNRGTIGGNVANASPAGDTFPALAVYGARVAVASAQGRRDVDFLDVFAGVKRTILAKGELIESIELPAPSSKPDRQVFRKVGTREAQAVSKTVAAGLLWLGPGRTVRELRFALGSMAPTVRRLKAAEAFLKGRRLDPKVIKDAVDLLARDVSPIDDIRSTAEYRLEVSRNILRSFLESGFRFE